MVAWHGVYPAVTSKHPADGSVDLGAPQSSIERLIAHGVDGIIVPPMLGDTASMRLDERAAIVRAARNGRQVAFVRPCRNLNRSDRAARTYRSSGLEGLMVVASFACKYDPLESAAWYQTFAIARELPLFARSPTGSTSRPRPSRTSKKRNASSASRRNPAIVTNLPTYSTRAASAFRSSAESMIACSKAWFSAPQAGFRA